MRYKAQLALKPSMLRQIDELRQKLREAEETLSAIGTGQVDAVVVTGPKGAKQIFTLKGADHPYRMLIESMNEGALTLSDQGVILYCNARMAALAGRPLERMMGQRFPSLLVNGDASAVMDLLRSARSPKKTMVKLRLAKGAVPVQLSLTPLDLDGTRAFCAVVTDLTEAFAMRHAMRQTEAGLRLVAESAPAILFTADAHGRVLSSSGAALKTIGGRVGALLATPSAGRNSVPARSLLLRAVRTGQAAYDVLFASRRWKVKLERLGIGAVIGVAVEVAGTRKASDTYH